MEIIVVALLGLIAVLMGCCADASASVNSTHGESKPRGTARSFERAQRKEVRLSDLIKRLAGTEGVRPTVPVRDCVRKGVGLHLTRSESKMLRDIRERATHVLGVSFRVNLVDGNITPSILGAVPKGENSILPEGLSRHMLAQCEWSVVWPIGWQRILAYDATKGTVTFKGGQEMPQDVLVEDWHLGNEGKPTVDLSESHNFPGEGRLVKCAPNPGTKAQAWATALLERVMRHGVTLSVYDKAEILRRVTLTVAFSSPNGVKHCQAVYTVKGSPLDKFLRKVFRSAQELLAYGGPCCTSDFVGALKLVVGKDIHAEEIVFLPDEAEEFVQDQDILVGDALPELPSIAQVRTLGFNPDWENGGTLFSKGTLKRVSYVSAVRIGQAIGLDLRKAKLLISPATRKGHCDLVIKDGVQINIGVLRTARPDLRSSVVPLHTLWMGSLANKAAGLDLSSQERKMLERLNKALERMQERTARQLVEVLTSQFDAGSAARTFAQQIANAEASYGHFDGQDGSESENSRLLAWVLLEALVMGADPKKLFLGGNIGSALRRTLRGLLIKGELRMANHDHRISAFEEELFGGTNIALVVERTDEWRVNNWPRVSKKEGCEDPREFLNVWAKEIQLAMRGQVSPAELVDDLKKVFRKAVLSRSPGRTHENLVPCIVVPGEILGIMDQDLPGNTWSVSYQAAQWLDGDFDGDDDSVVFDPSYTTAVWAFNSLRLSLGEALVKEQLPFKEEDAKPLGLPYVAKDKNVTPCDEAYKLMAKLAATASGGTTDNLGLLVYGIGCCLLLGWFDLAAKLAQATQVDVQGIKKVTHGLYNESGGLQQWVWDILGQISEARKEYPISFWSDIATAGRFGNTVKNIPMEDELPLASCPQGRTIRGLTETLRSLLFMGVKDTRGLAESYYQEFVSWAQAIPELKDINFKAWPKGMREIMENVRAARRAAIGAGYQSGLYNEAYQAFIIEGRAWAEFKPGETAEQYLRRLANYVGHAYYWLGTREAKPDAPEVLLAVLIEARMKRFFNKVGHQFTAREQVIILRTLENAKDIPEKRRAIITRAVGELEADPDMHLPTIEEMLDGVELPEVEDTDDMTFTTCNMFLGKEPRVAAAKARMFAGKVVWAKRREVESAIAGTGSIYVWHKDLVAIETLVHITHCHNRVVVFGGRGPKEFGAMKGKYTDFLALANKHVAVVKGQHYKPKADAYWIGDKAMQAEGTILIRANIQEDEDEGNYGWVD